MFKFSKNLINEALWVLLTQVSNIFLNIYIISKVSFLLSVEQYGSLALALTIQAFFSLIFYGSINNGVLRYSSLSIQWNKIETFFKSVIKLNIIFGGTLIFSAVIFSSFFFLIGKLNYIKPFNIILILSIFIGLVDFITSIILALRRRKFLFSLKTLELITKIIFLFLIPIDNYIDILLIYLISSLISCLLIFFYFKSYFSNFSLKLTMIDFYWIKKIYVYSLPFLIWSIFVWAQQNSVKWALEAFVSRKELGFFNALFQIGYSPVIILFGIIMNFITPIIFQKIDPKGINKNSEKLLIDLYKFSFVGLILVFICAILIIPASDFLVRIIFPIEYSEISNFVPIVFIASGFYSIGIFLSNIPFSLNSPKTLLKSTVISSLIGIISSIILTFEYGFIGSVYSLLIFGIIYYFSAAITIYKSHLSFIS